MNTRYLLRDISVVISIYAAILGIFSLKTIYYFSFQNTYWWLYLFVLTASYLYAVYFAYSGNQRVTSVLLVVSILIGYMPYEEEMIRIRGILYNSIVNLSPVSQKMPLFFGVLADMFFYPVIIFFPLSFLHLVSKKRRSKQ